MYCDQGQESKKDRKGIFFKHWEEEEESELQKSFDLEVIKTLLNAEDVVKTCCGRGKNMLGTART